MIKDQFDPDWRPGAEVERDLLEAVRAHDTHRVARLLRGSPVYVPTMAAGTEIQWSEQDSGIGTDHVVVFTSPMTLFRALAGHAMGYTEDTLDGLRERWSNSSGQFVINPRSPVEVLLSTSQLDELGQGVQPPAPPPKPLPDPERLELRLMVLAELGIELNAASAILSEIRINDAERKLLSAEKNSDPEAFLVELLRSEVWLLTRAPLVRRNELHDPNVWWPLAGIEDPVVPAFSSFSVIDRMAPPAARWFPVRFVDLLALWPSLEYGLIFNPGTEIEYVLSGREVGELTAAILKSDVDE